jgi:hypothetical protein
MEYNKQVLSMFPKVETKKKEEVKKENKQDTIKVFNKALESFLKFWGGKEVKGTRAMKSLDVKSGEKRDYLSCKVARKVDEGIEVRTAILTYKKGFPTMTTRWLQNPLDREIIKTN